MKVRTFFWRDRVISNKQMFLRKAISSQNSCYYFNHGNAGDLFMLNLVEHYYNVPTINVKNSGNRLLGVGSIAHKILENDLLCGIGVKSPDVPLASQVNCKILGLRGPLSYEAFKKAGHFLGDLKFLADPGLLIQKFINKDQKPQIGKILFIPHYRERFLYKSKTLKGIDVADIDVDPLLLGEKILQAELVLSSSLHGIIFAHSLGRPCTFILPQTREPMIKFIDYFESVDIAEPHPVKIIFDYQPSCPAILPKDIENKINSIVFPNIEFLEKHNIIVT